MMIKTGYEVYIQQRLLAMKYSPIIREQYQENNVCGHEAAAVILKNRDPTGPKSLRQEHPRRAIACGRIGATNCLAVCFRMSGEGRVFGKSQSSSNLYIKSFVQFFYWLLLILMRNRATRCPRCPTVFLLGVLEALISKRARVDLGSR